MSGEQAATTRANVAGRGAFMLVFLLSSSILAFEVSLMRVLLLSGWHHFAFLVISIALLGFGSSGVFLYLFQRRIMQNAKGWLFGLTLATAISMPLCVSLLNFLPIESRFIPTLLMRQLFWWLLYWFILLLPFFIGAAAIGLALMMSGVRISTMYASNLAGSAGGALLVTLLLLLETTVLAYATGALALVAAIAAPGISLNRKTMLLSLTVVVILGLRAVMPKDIRSDPYKYHSYVKQLEQQDQAIQVTERHGNTGVIHVYYSDMFHDLAFLSGSETPPPMHSILLDGHLAASVLDVSSAEESTVVDHVLSAAVYELLGPQPAVLLPGELGGSNIWLAARHHASRINVVHHYPMLVDILENELRENGGEVLDLPGVQYHNAYPRHFIETSADAWDLIQFTALESLPAGSGGMAGLGQNHLMTVQGISAALRRLTDDGILVLSRGIQDPPRDNLKIMALLAEALRHNGVVDVHRHIVIVRDFLAVCCMVRSSPWSASQLRQVEEMVKKRNLTGVWWEGIHRNFLNTPDELIGPPDHDGDWYHYAAGKLFFDGGKAFIRDWLFDIRPPTDDRPFFHDFSRLGTIKKLQEVFGDLWLTRAEVGLLFVLVAMFAVGVVALLMTILPLLFVRSGYAFASLAPAAGYFACLGLAYLILEIAMLSRLTHLIGSPVVAAAVTIASFLFFSGLGSLTAQRVRMSNTALAVLVISLAVVALLCFVGTGPATRLAGGSPLWIRILIAVALTAPPSYLMGFPMPSGLTRLQHGPDQLIAWAWGVNGFTSVLAAPAATLIGMVWGFSWAALIAVALYLLAIPLYARIPTTASRVKS
jgi:hypothetical protein